MNTVCKASIFFIILIDAKNNIPYCSASFVIYGTYIDEVYR